MCNYIMPILVIILIFSLILCDSKSINSRNNDIINDFILRSNFLITQENNDGIFKIL